jgi:hypothetical protein
MINRSAEIVEFKAALTAAQPLFKGRKVMPSTEFEKWAMLRDRQSYDYSGASLEVLKQMQRYAESEVQIKRMSGQYTQAVNVWSGLAKINEELESKI